MKTFISRTLLISLTLLLSSSVQVYAQSFTEPPSAPPNNNAYAPLDTSSQGQAKAGGLDLNSSGAPNGLIVEQGNVGIGTPTPATTLNVIGKVGALAYCDENGNNCITPGQSNSLRQYLDIHGLNSFPTRVSYTMTSSPQQYGVLEFVSYDPTLAGGVTYANLEFDAGTFNQVLCSYTMSGALSSLQPSSGFDHTVCPLQLSMDGRNLQ